MFTIHFGGKIPLFLETTISLPSCARASWSSSCCSCRVEGAPGPAMIAAPKIHALKTTSTSFWLVFFIWQKMSLIKKAFPKLCWSSFKNWMYRLIYWKVNFSLGKSLYFPRSTDWFWFPLSLGYPYHHFALTPTGPTVPGPTGESGIRRRYPHWFIVLGEKKVATKTFL